MDDQFKIYIDQLRNGKVEAIQLQVFPSFLEITEGDLEFEKEIAVSGEAYIAEEELVLHLNIEAEAIIPCSICNEPVDVPISLKGVYHVEPLEEIRGAIFDFKDVIRENILLETPSIAECHGGACPGRKEIGKYIKEASSDEENEEDEGYQPFSDLKLE